jgi:hypothetical protein
MAHLPLKKLLAFHYDQLDAAEKDDVQAHLEACASCEKNLTLLVRPEQALKIKPASTGTRVAERTACLSPETIGKYTNHELLPAEIPAAEKHLASCEDCRHQLVAIAQISIEPVSEEARKILEGSPPLEISEHVNAIMKLMPAAEVEPNRLERWNDWIHAHIPELRFARNVAVAGGIMAAIFFAGEQPFRNWRANAHANTGVESLKQEWTITFDDLRPAENLREDMFSVTHGPEDKALTDKIEGQFRAALAWDKNNRTARLGLATYRYFIGDLIAADSVIAVLLDENSQDFEAWNNRGLIAARREDSTAALTAFVRALQIRPDYAIAAYNRASLLHQLGRRNEARAAWQEYLKLDATSKWGEVAQKRLQESDK